MSESIPENSIPFLKKPNKIKVSIISSKFNENIVTELLDTTEIRLIELGVAKENISKIFVPGAFEIPFAVIKAKEKFNPHSIICLGAIIRGQTTHYDLISKSVFSSLSYLNTSISIPVINGVITTENITQAEERISNGNYYAESCIEMIKL